MVLEAQAAVHRPTLGWPEGDGRSRAAFCANSGVALGRTGRKWSTGYRSNKRGQKDSLDIEVTHEIQRGAKRRERGV